MKHVMRSLVCAASVAVLAGCAAGPSYTWMATGSATTGLDQALAKCDYETSAATQATDYSFRTSFGQELDRAIRKNNLMEKCMRAQGFQQVAVGAGKKLEDDPRWKALEQDWEALTARRTQLAGELNATPRGGETESIREEIRSLNARIANLEKKLSYARSTPVNVD